MGGSFTSRPELRRRFEGATALVTGGAGFIGGHLVEHLVGLGARVRVIDDLSNAEADRVSRLVEEHDGRVSFHYASILEAPAVNRAAEGCDYVFHLAAMGSVPQSIREPRRCVEVNVQGTQVVLDAARAGGARRFIYSASSSAYGESEELPKREEMAADPVSPYAASKLAGEYLVRAWSRTYGLDGVSLRYFNIFGPHQAADSAYAAVIAAFATRLLSGKRPVIYGDGEQSRDFTYVENAVLANLLAASSEEPFRGEVINIGSSRRTTINELVGMMASIIGAPPDSDHEPERAGDVRHSVASIDRARELLGYEVAVPLEDGLSRTIRWYERQSGRCPADVAAG